MDTQIELLSSWYSKHYVVCPKCRKRAGYTHWYDSGVNWVFKCECGKGLTQIKKEAKDERKKNGNS